MEPLHYFLLGVFTGGGAAALIAQFVAGVRAERARLSERRHYEPRNGWPRH